MGNNIPLNFDVANAPPPLIRGAVPAGWYLVAVKDSDYVPNSKQTGKMLTLNMEILEGEYKGRMIFDRLNLENPSPDAVQIAYGTLGMIGKATGVLRMQNSFDLHGKPMKVRVTFRPAGTAPDGKAYGESNECQEYVSANTPTPGGPAAAGAGGPGSPPVWAGPQAPGTLGAAVGALAQTWGGQAPPQPQQPQPGAMPVPQGSFPQPPQPMPTPPQPQAPQRQMTPKAGPTPYEWFTQNGWSDDALIREGYMVLVASQPPAPSYPQPMPQPPQPQYPQPPQPGYPQQPQPGGPGVGPPAQNGWVPPAGAMPVGGPMPPQPAGPGGPGWSRP